jgi:hypothetical protein
MMFTHGVTWLACVDDDGFYKGYVTQRGITQLLGASYRDDRDAAARALRHGAAVLFFAVFALGAYLQARGVLPGILRHWSDIVYLSRQHMQLVAISGAIAIASACRSGSF